jgi:hypothetical protein
MPTAHEHFSEQFQKWERRGRGWQVHGQPVFPEPPFAPFRLRSMTEAPVIDNAVRPSFLGSIFNKFLAPPAQPTEQPIELELEEEPKPKPLSRYPLVEFQASLPDKLDVSREAFKQFLSSLSLCREPIAFELVGTHKKVATQFAAAASDAPLVRRQLRAFFPEAVFVPVENALATAWNTSGAEVLALEFGLAHEFMLPLASGKLDPFIGIVGALAELQAGELGLFQVLFQPVNDLWAESILNSVTGADGRPLFVNAPELTGAAENKVARPLFAAVVRIMVCTANFERTVQLACDLSASLRVFKHPDGNELIPLNNDDYGFEEHIEDVLRRQTRRSGMILNGDELTGFVHIPSSTVRSPSFQRQTAKTKAAPNIVRHKNGLLLGENEHAGEKVEVRLSPEQRVKHCHILGASGTGKSTLLYNLIKQDIDNGEGVAVLDPHGDLIDRILGIIPPERVDDVILVDPVNDRFSIGFNILLAHSHLEKNLLASDLIAVFQRLSTSWGDQMNSVLQNAILAFLESDRRGTIADLQRFLIEPDFRHDFLKSVKDSHIVNYWQKSFPLLSGNKSIGSIITRLDAFLAQKPIRNMMSQSENKLNFAEIMDSGKIFLVKLPEGLLGRENAHLLGTLLVSKFQQIAMSRQARQIESRRPFNIVIDECTNFITPSMAEILSGARKYRLGLTLAHHDLQQLQRSPDVASAVLTHPATRIVFKVGDEDAKKLAEGFSYFEADDLRNLEVGQAIARVERSDFDFNLTIPLPDEVDTEAAKERRQEVITRSGKRYGTPRAEIEALLAANKTSPSNEPLAEVHRSKSITPKPLAIPVLADLPKVSETQKSSEGPKKVAQLANNETKRHDSQTSREPRDLGRGGNQHQAIQKRIKEAAEKLGFRSIIEKPVLDGSGSVDLFLERDGQSIACEISVSTTIDHEVGNVAKCFKANLPQVAVICLDDERLEKIEAAVSGSLGSEQASSVHYFRPDPFIEYLKSLLVEPPKKSEKIRRGYKVKHSQSSSSIAEQKAKEEAAIRAIAESMQ